MTAVTVDPDATCCDATALPPLAMNVTVKYVVTDDVLTLVEVVADVVVDVVVDVVSDSELVASELLRQLDNKRTQRANRLVPCLNFIDRSSLYGYASYNFPREDRRSIRCGKSRSKLGCVSVR